MREAAAQEEAKLIGAAHAEATSHIQGIREKVSAEAKAASEQLKKETQTIAEEIASKVLGRELK